MDKKIEDLYKEYQKIMWIIKDKTEEKDKLYSSLLKSQVGKLYFSLNDEQKTLFEKIYRYGDFYNYISLRDDINEFQEKVHKVEYKIFEHKDFPFKDMVPAIFITDGVDTYNALSDESTKDVDIADADKEIIKDIISNTLGFKSEFEVSDIPLIKVIYNKVKKNLANHANYIIEDNILKQVKRIHNLDKKHSTYKENRRYFIEDLKESITSSELEIRNSNSGFKYLLLYSIETAKYEVSLLEGKRVTTILKEIDESNMSESEKDYKKDALVEAYYNLTNIEFRKQSEYFDNDNDICYATFETANPEINKRLIKMRQGK